MNFPLSLSKRKKKRNARAFRDKTARRLGRWQASAVRFCLLPHTERERDDVLFCTVQQHLHASLRICFFVHTVPPSPCPISTAAKVGRPRIVCLSLYPYHLSIIEHKTREGSVGGGSRMFAVHVQQQGCLLSSPLVKTLSITTQTLMGTISPTSSAGAPRVPFPSWLPPAARRVVRGRLSLAR